MAENRLLERLRELIATYGVRFCPRCERECLTSSCGECGTAVTDETHRLIRSWLVNLEPLNEEGLYLDWLNDVYGTISVCGELFSAGDVYKRLRENALKASARSWALERAADGLLFTLEDGPPFYDSEDIEKLLTERYRNWVPHRP
jgi:hypothetical protein